MKKMLLIAGVLLLWCIVAALTLAGATGGSTEGTKAKTATVSGYVSDSVCGTKGPAVGYADCTNKCLVKGAQLVIVVDQSQAILTIDNPDVVKGHECHHVLVTGDINTHTNVIHIYSLRIL